MLKYKTYVKILSILLIAVFGGAFIYVYIYAKNYPIPLFHRISIDAKMMFIRDMPNKEAIDTIIVGSSIGLNNVNGVILEKSSSKVNHVLNLSSFSSQMTQIEQLWEIFTLFPNLKRVIYAVQSLDFTGTPIYNDFDADFIKKYINLGEKNINLSYSLYTYKYLLNIIERQYSWKNKHMANNNFTSLSFDRTGSVPLHIYGDDIIKKRWDNPWVVPTKNESYIALKRMLKKSNKNNIIFYLAIQPYRGPLVKKDKHLRDILKTFHKKSKETVLVNGGKFLNLHDQLQLDDKYFADRIHLNDKGSIIIAQEIGKFIDSNE